MGWGIPAGKDSPKKIIKSVRRGHRDKGRSLQTYQNKLKKLETYYKNLYKASKHAKDKSIARSFYFFEKYSTLDKFRDTVEIKVATNEN